MSRIRLKMEVESGVTESGQVQVARLFSQQCNLIQRSWIEGVDIAFEVHGIEVTVLPGAGEADIHAAMAAELAKPAAQRKGLVVGPNGVKGLLLTT